MHKDLSGTGKAVDDNNPIVPIQKPRGYGGVGVLWNKSLDNVITTLPDGGNRIQCVELKTKEKPFIFISVYMPCKGKNSNIDDFRDCVDQLDEIITKYENSHTVIVGGDINEDIHKKEQSSRKAYIQELISDHDLQVTSLGSTFIHPNGKDCSEIDYFLYRNSVHNCVTKVYKNNEMHSNVSDHYPISCTLRIDMQNSQTVTSKSDKLPSKVPWKKVDKDMYSTKVTESVQIMNMKLNTHAGLDETLHNMNNLLVSAANACYKQKKKVTKRKPRLTVWTDDVRQALKDSKDAHYRYKTAQTEGTLDDHHIDERKKAKRTLRSEIRKEQARKHINQKESILQTKVQDTKLFHKLIKEQRGGSSDTTNEIVVNQKIYNGGEVIQGWKEHFEQLACSADKDPSFDVKYIQQVEDDFYVIMDICQNTSDCSKTKLHTTEDEVTSAIKNLNMNKSPDVYGVTAEHVSFAGSTFVSTLTVLFNAILASESIPDSLKLGTITPVFKKKGHKRDCKNYRGTTVLPVLGKLLEIILRNRLRNILDDQQNPLQRGFTASSSPLNCALIIEEFIRESQDIHSDTFVALLDAKAAFDVVNHHSLLRKLYNYGVDGCLWNLICDFHCDAVSAVKWEGGLSETFVVTQGVRQGGILSADLYKLYINDLLNRLQNSRVGGKIGHIDCSAPTCADDMTNLSNTPNDLQVLCNIAHDYSTMEQYMLQPTKSVVLPVTTQKKSKSSTVYQTEKWTLGDADMPIVDSATHVGLVRSSKPTADAAIEANIQKGRRTLYSLMSSGLHGENGLDIETSVHLLKVYVIPVLVYGLEIYLPRETTIKPLETMFKKTLKHILSLPVTAADPSPYILSGLIPLEGVVHIRALNLFGNICNLPDTSIEKQLACRQISIKPLDSHSWFSYLQILLIKYDLPDAYELLQYPPKKEQWKTLVSRTVYGYWKHRIVSNANS